MGHTVPQGGRVPLPVRSGHPEGEIRGIPHRRRSTARAMMIADRFDPCDRDRQTVRFLRLKR